MKWRCGGVQWKAKLSDYGSANIVCNISASSVYPGNPFYSAAETGFPIHHSPAMDVLFWCTANGDDPL